MSGGMKCVTLGPAVASIRAKANRVYQEISTNVTRSTEMFSYRVPNNFEYIHGLQTYEDSLRHLG